MLKLNKLTALEKNLNIFNIDNILQFTKSAFRYSWTGKGKYGASPC
jgi:hypothetical protein